jgi:hypothetical protein
LKDSVEGGLSSKPYLPTHVIPTMSPDVVQELVGISCGGADRLATVGKSGDQGRHLIRGSPISCSASVDNLE